PPHRARLGPEEQRHALHAAAATLGVDEVVPARLGGLLVLGLDHELELGAQALHLLERGEHERRPRHQNPPVSVGRAPFGVYVSPRRAAAYSRSRCITMGNPSDHWFTSAAMRW